MGKYVPFRWEDRKTVAKALAEAEEDHYLDCPNAETGPRLAAMILDIIFLFLFTSLLTKMTGILIEILQDQDGQISSSLSAFAHATKFATIALAGYFSQIWSVWRYGASPAKLILGLRVVDSQTGANLSLGKSFFRELVAKCLITSTTLGFVLLVPLFRSDHLALHDLLARSTVKRIRPH